MAQSESRRPAPAALSFMILEIEDLRFCGKINEMWSAIKHHVREEFRLVNLTSLGAGNSDPYGHFFFNQVGQIVVGAVAGRCLLIKVPGFVRPRYSPVNEEKIYPVFFCVGNLCELETSCCRFDLILA